MLCKEAIVYGYAYAVGICISVRDQAVLKAKHQQILRLTIRNDVVQHFISYNKGKLSF